MNHDSPLRGLRVVEVAEALAGPYCAMVLGDLGADVIKIERPKVGDQARGWGPPFLEGESAYFLAANRNKRSIELDLKDTADLDVLHRLMAGADVFVTNNPRMESLRRAGMDPETTRSRNPRLVYVAISGYGHTGPKAGRPGYDILAQGEAGLMALTGPVEGGPARFPTPMADLSAGLYAALGVLTALYARDGSSGTGIGDFLDVSLLEAQAAWLANVGSSYLATGERPERLGNAHPTITPYQPMRARDKELIVAVGSERVWERLCSSLGIADSVMRDPRFATNAARNRHRGELVRLLEGVLAERDAAEWTELFTSAGIPSAPINRPDETLTDPHLRARGLIVELEHPLIGIVRSTALPVHFAHSGPTYRRAPPLLGEHNREIRAELANVPNQLRDTP